MRITLVSRYPRVDVWAWKRQLAQGLSDAGFELSFLYSRARLIDQVRAGLDEFGPNIVKRYVGLRFSGRSDGAQTGSQSLAGWAAERSLPIRGVARLGDRKALEAVRELRPDLLVLVGADIVPRAVLEVARVAAINAHFGLLPAYRGMNVTEWSVYQGAPAGVTVHIVDSGIDTGDLLAREEIEIEPGETFDSLRLKHREVASRLLLDSAVRLRDGTAQRTSQRLEDGRQHYRMHPLLRAAAERRLNER